MKRLLFLLFLSVTVGVVVASSARGPSESEIAQLKEMAGPPPGSLDNLYPPKCASSITSRED